MTKTTETAAKKSPRQAKGLRLSSEHQQLLRVMAAIDDLREADVVEQALELYLKERMAEVRRSIEPEQGSRASAGELKLIRAVLPVDLFESLEQAFIVRGRPGDGSSIDE
jgi:hypothetical protein